MIWSLGRQAPLSRKIIAHVPPVVANGSSNFFKGHFVLPHPRFDSASAYIHALCQFRLRDISVVQRVRLYV